MSLKLRYFCQSVFRNLQKGIKIIIIGAIKMIYPCNFIEKVPQQITKLLRNAPV